MAVWSSGVSTAVTSRERRDAARMDLLQHLHDRELHVGGGERLAVVELHALAQLERHGLAVRAHLEAFGETRLRLQVEAVFQQAVEDLGGDLTDRPGRRDVRREVRRFRLGDLDQRAARFLRERWSAREHGNGRGQQVCLCRSSHVLISLPFVSLCGRGRRPGYAAPGARLSHYHQDSAGLNAIRILPLDLDKSANQSPASRVVQWCVC